RVRIGERVRVAAGVGDLELIPQRQLGALQDALEHAVAAVDALQLDVGGLDHDALGVGTEGADDDAVLRRVGAQVGVRISQIHPNGSSSSRWMPATGMRTQSGRLLSS